MIENRAEQTQVAPDEEIRINVVEDNYDEQGNATASQEPDELERYTKMFLAGLISSTRNTEKQSKELES